MYSVYAIDDSETENCRIIAQRNMLHGCDQTTLSVVLLYSCICLEECATMYYCTGLHANSVKKHSFITIVYFLPCSNFSNVR